MNNINFSANEILNVRYYNQLFSMSSDKENLLLYKKLLKKWHPDMNKDDTSNVFIHIMNIFQKHSNTEIKTETVDDFQFNYLFKISTDLYNVYYESSSTIYIIFNDSKIAEKLTLNYSSNLFTINENLKGHPLKSRYDELANAKIYSRKNLYMIKLKGNYIPLTLLLEHITDIKDWKLSAYIISRMFDMVNMYNYFGLSCIGFDPNLLLVDTKTHKIVDLSALLFSTKMGSKMIALSGFQANVFDKDDLKNKVCSSKSELNMMKSLSYRLAGDITGNGNHLLLDKDIVNKDLIKVIHGFNNVKTSYEKWINQDITTLFHQRSFYKKELTMKDLLKYINS